MNLQTDRLKESLSKYKDTGLLVSDNILDNVVSSVLNNTEELLTGKKLEEEGQELYDLLHKRVNSGDLPLPKAEFDLGDISSQVDDMIIAKGFNIRDYREFEGDYIQYMKVLEEFKKQGILDANDMQKKPTDILEILKNISSEEKNKYIKFEDYSLSDILDINEKLAKINEILDGETDLDEIDDDQLLEIKKICLSDSRIVDLFPFTGKAGYKITSTFLSNKEDIDLFIKLGNKIVETTQSKNRDVLLKDYLQNFSGPDGKLAIIEKVSEYNKNISDLNLEYTTSRGFKKLGKLVELLLIEKDIDYAKKIDREIVLEIQNIIKLSLNRKFGRQLLLGNENKEKTYSRLYSEYYGTGIDGNGGSFEGRDKIERRLIRISTGRDFGLDELREIYTNNCSSEDNISEDIKKNSKSLNTFFDENGIEVSIHKGHIGVGADNKLHGKEKPEAKVPGYVEYDKTSRIISYIKSKEIEGLDVKKVISCNNGEYTFFRVGKKSIFVSNLFGKATYVFHTIVELIEGENKLLREIGQYSIVNFVGIEDEQVSNWEKRIYNELLDENYSGKIGKLNKLGFFTDADLLSDENINKKCKIFNKLTEYLHSKVDKLDDSINLDDISNEILELAADNYIILPDLSYKDFGISPYIESYIAGLNRHKEKYTNEEPFKIQELFRQYMDGNLDFVDRKGRNIIELFQPDDGCKKTKTIENSCMSFVSDIDKLRLLKDDVEEFCNEDTRKGVVKKLDIPYGIRSIVTMIINLGGSPNKQQSKDLLPVIEAKIKRLGDMKDIKEMIQKLNTDNINDNIGEITEYIRGLRIYEIIQIMEEIGYKVENFDVKNLDEYIEKFLRWSVESK